MKAEKLKSGNYRIKLYIGADATGKKIFKSFTAPTVKEARLLAEEYKLATKKKNVANMTVRDAVQEYISSIEGVSSPKTIREYYGYARTHMQQIYDIRIVDLTKNDVQKAISDEAEKYSPKSVRNYWALVSAALNSQGIIFTDLKFPQKMIKNIVVPTETEFNDILDIVRGTKFYVPVLLASMGGLRRGEIAALDYTKDIIDGKVIINKSMTEDKNGVWFVKDFPKTFSSNRIVDLPDIVVEAIEEEIENGITHSIHPAYITSGFARLMSREGKHVRFHDLRHLYASMLLSINIPNKYAAAMMGHSSTEMTERVYQHIMPDKFAEECAKAQAYLNTIGKKSFHKVSTQK